MTLRKQFIGFLAILLNAFPLYSQPIRIGGADTLIYLGQRFAEQYRAKHPGAQFAVHGGGQAAAKNENIDIVQAEGAGAVDKRVAFSIAVHGIVIYVNRTSAVRELTVSQVRNIFLGQITNWKELGGPDRHIKLYAAESTTGTLAFFQESVLHGEEPYPFEGKSNTHALLEVIAADPWAIGYGTLDANPNVRGLPIKSGLTSLPIEPTISTIRSREYPITREIYWMADRKAAQEVKEFCGWVLSQEGQLVVEGAGFEPILPQERSAGLTRLGLKETVGAVASR